MLKSFENNVQCQQYSVKKQFNILSHLSKHTLKVTQNLRQGQFFFKSNQLQKKNHTLKGID